MPDGNPATDTLGSGGTMKTFIRITNEQIFKKIEEMHNDIQKIKTGVELTNEKVKLHNKLIFALYGLIGAIIVAFVSAVLN